MSIGRRRRPNARRFWLICASCSRSRWKEDAREVGVGFFRALADELLLRGIPFQILAGAQGDDDQMAEADRDTAVMKEALWQRCEVFEQRKAHDRQWSTPCLPMSTGC